MPEAWLSEPEPAQGAPHRAKVTAAKEVHVNQQRVEVVEVAALLEEAWSNALNLCVALEKRIAEGVEEAYEGQFYLGVGVVDRRVEEGGYAIPLCEHIGTPHVAVDERGAFGFFQILVEPLRQPLHPL